MESIKYKRHQSEEMFQIQKSKVKELKEKCYEKLIKQAEYHIFIQRWEIDIKCFKKPIQLNRYKLVLHII